MSVPWEFCQLWGSWNLGFACKSGHGIKSQNIDQFHPRGSQIWIDTMNRLAEGGWRAVSQDIWAEYHCKFLCLALLFPCAVPGLTEGLWLRKNMVLLIRNLPTCHLQHFSHLHRLVHGSPFPTPSLTTSRTSLRTHLFRKYLLGIYYMSQTLC